MGRTNSSSQLRMATPPSAARGRACTSSDLAWAMRSMVPNRSKWLGPTLVITPTWGRANSHSRVISPIAYMPISSTARSCSVPSPSRVRGRPCSLFKLPVEARVVKRLASTLAAISLVLVLPTLPVMPITRRSARLRCRR